MEKPFLYFVITRNCCYECRHCYIEAMPGLKDTTIEEKDFRKTIRHLPKVSLDLMLTGGEIFTIKDTLYSYLDYISYDNIKRKKRNQGPISIDLQTNGYWATSDERIENVLEELHDFGVTMLDITSYDRYHLEQGADLKNIRQLVELAGDSEFFDEVLLRGTSRSLLAHLGRAKKMNLRFSDMRTGSYTYCKHSLDDYRLSMSQDGNVYACCFQMFPLPGNVIQEPLVNIVRRARKDPILMSLNKKSIKGFAREHGWSKKDIKALIRKNGECGFCFRVTKNT